MANCCKENPARTMLREKHSRVLRIVLFINALMFLLKAAYGWLSHSTSLSTDSLDMSATH